MGIELNYGNKCTINTGNYENISPMFNIKKIIEGGDVDIVKEFEDMKTLVDGQINAYIKAHQTEILNPRIYEKDGKKYISVTQVITPIKPKIPNFELYGVRGDIYHRIFEKWTTKGKYEVDITNEEKKRLEPIKGIDETALDWVTQLKDVEYITSERVVYNDEYMYAGKYDACGLYNKCPVVFDLKSGRIDTDKCYMQLSAYAKAIGDISSMMVFSLQDKKIYTSEKIDFYFGMFIKARKDFKERWGV